MHCVRTHCNLLFLHCYEYTKLIILALSWSVLTSLNDTCPFSSLLITAIHRLHITTSWLQGFQHPATSQRCIHIVYIYILSYATWLHDVHRCVYFSSWTLLTIMTALKWHLTFHKTKPVFLFIGNVTPITHCANSHGFFVATLLQTMPAYQAPSQTHSTTILAFCR